MSIGHPASPSRIYSKTLLSFAWRLNARSVCERRTRSERRDDGGESSLSEHRGPRFGVCLVSIPKRSIQTRPPSQDFTDKPYRYEKSYFTNNPHRAKKLRKGMDSNPFPTQSCFNLQIIGCHRCQICPRHRGPLHHFTPRTIRSEVLTLRRVLTTSFPADRQPVMKP